MHFKKTILACITAQYSCQRIIEIAKDFAKNLSCELNVITVQPVETKAEQRSKDMICLTTLSKLTNTEIKIIYSNDPIACIVQQIKEIRPIHMFIGQGNEKSQFMSKLRTASIQTPISVVGSNSIIFTLPPRIINDVYEMSEKTYYTIS